MDSQLYNYTLFWICILGACLGSFYNVVILRSLTNESIVFPSSKCPKCGEKLKPWHNIPIFSYIFLRGKCAFCKEKISIQYPIIEILTAILFAICFVKFGYEWKTIFAMFISSALVIMSMTDLKEKLVDRFIHFIAPKILGDDTGKTSVRGFDLVDINDSLNLKLVNMRKVMPDIMCEYKVLY